MIVVLDTSILIAYLLSRGKTYTRDIVKLAKAKKILLASSSETVQEFKQRLSVVTTSKFPYYKPRIGGIFVAWYQYNSRLFPITKQQLRFKSRDAKDTMFLELAKASKATYIISGDKDLLELRRIGQTKIVTPQECIKRESRNCYNQAMTLLEARRKYQKSLKQFTLCFLVKENQVLLGMKKRGFGVGKYNGIGGKVQLGESVLEAAKRETQEEIGVTVKTIEQVATIYFYTPLEKDMGQHVIAFLVKDWQGEPTESEEMKPQWFGTRDIPFATMWPDDAYWLPLVLEGKKLEGEFLFGKNETILDHQLTILSK